MPELQQNSWDETALAGPFMICQISSDTVRNTVHCFMLLQSPIAVLLGVLG